jgi:glycosyltransferase involved in cell wall biosynthesis
VPVAKLPPVTVVTPCLNAAATLPETLASVSRQAYPDLEHIAIDGGSTDGTLDILAAAQGIRYISEPDRGLAHALNKGIAMAGGDVIGCLNADDLYAPDALLAVGREFARRPDAAWVTGRCSIVDGTGREIRRPITMYKNFLLSRYSLDLYLTHNFISAPATFVRRRAFSEVGAFDERYAVSVDYDLFLRLAIRYRPLILNRELAAFRMTEGTLSMSRFDGQFREHAEQARRHGTGHPISVAANQVISRLIVLAYRAMRRVRRLPGE